MAYSSIKIIDACQNNLKKLRVEVPLNQITAVTGLSGSGKSSLAFDTLYAEGQRRYVETFSPYARQFMDRMDRPLVKKIEGIPPAIAIDRKDPVRTSRSTVGTMTEVTDYVKLVFARMGVLYCDTCGQPVQKDTPQTVWHWVETQKEDTPLYITYPYQLDEDASANSRDFLKKTGFDRIFTPPGTLTSVDKVGDPKAGEWLYVLVDRVKLNYTERKRIIDSLELAFRFGNGKINLFTGDTTPHAFSDDLFCDDCQKNFQTATHNLFSFNSPVGACGTCRGFGRVIDVDLDLIIPDPSLSIREGAIKPWGSWEDHRFEFHDLLAFCKKMGIPTDIPFKKLSATYRNHIIDGHKDFYGIRGFFRWLEKKKYKMHVRVYLSRYRSYDICPVCRGSRFKPEALRYKVGDKRISDIYAMDVDNVFDFFGSLSLDERNEADMLVLQQVISRLRFLKNVGVGYLTLDRQSRTLSGGEVQRVALASSLGASLVNTLYVLDEPSIGLHPRDTQRLMDILKRLRDLSNTVVVVEHDPEIITQSDHLIDLGPKSGENGGNIMYEGLPERINDSITGRYLLGTRKIPIPKFRRQPVKGSFITVRGASENNLKNLTVRIPLGLMVCLTGVSGSGKSTLAEEILYKGIKRLKNDSKGRPGQYRSIAGAELIRDVKLIDQRALGRTPRANILTYTKAMDTVRKLFAQTDDAVALGLTSSFFSFNVKGGRCETCRGDGFERVEMQFLSDVYVACPDCSGRRYKKKVLGVRYRNKNIHDVLNMTVAEALVFLKDSSPIQKALLPVAKVGLDYVRLGQPLNTFSGGEAQRLKLSAYLKKGAESGQLFIFDEPTTGLHLEEINILLDALTELTNNGHSLLMIEHNMDVIKTADWVIDLGPEGGDDGGRIVVEGPPEEVSRHKRSFTGRFLKKYLKRTPNYFLNKNTSSSPAVFEPAQEFLPGIQINGAREHNLKNLSLTLPRNELIVITGVSGSGKSSLAFDTIFAEGQRRYLESLTPYARQFIQVLEKPDVDLISGLPPTVAIEQRISHASRRSTVATLTEIYHFFRLLYSRLGTHRCTGCGRSLETLSEKALIKKVFESFKNKNALVLAPVVFGRKGFHKEVLATAYKQGLRRARIDSLVVNIMKDMALSRYHVHTIELVAGKLGGGKSVIEKALAMGKGTLIISDVQDHYYSIHGNCPACGIGVEPPDPKLFSFNSPRGACPDCDGIGRTISKKGVSHICEACDGSRLNKAALSITVKGRNIWSLVQKTAGDLLKELRKWKFTKKEKPIVSPILSEVDTRLSFLCRLGLDYMSLDRSGDTLSGGEAQRVRLAAQLGSNLTGVLYVLDEPTIGLHPRDNHMLLTALKSLRDRGNTVLVVEHDDETIRQADTVIDLGPGGGQAGGEIVALGSPGKLQKHNESKTFQWLNKRAKKSIREPRTFKNQSKITLVGASAHNLKDISVEFPMHQLIAVTGVSGSGKSTLVKHTLLEGLHIRLIGKKKSAYTCRRIKNWHKVTRVLEVDHSPIGRTPRSVPASYIGILTEIRHYFAQTQDAKTKGYGPARFSFNVKGGRCEACKGQGRPKVEMSFLPDVYVPCDVCEGARFNHDTLSVKYKGKSISEALEMTFEEAAQFFIAIPKIRKAMQLVCDIGLGYLRLGQPSPTLSGGEAQRIKLAKQLVKAANGHTFYVLDEPTTGLHIEDIHRVIDVLQRLVSFGNTVIAIEHNLEFINSSDYIIDLGPEGGEKGGHVVASGTPPEIMAAHLTSHTGRFLKKYISATHR